MAAAEEAQKREDADRKSICELAKDMVKRKASGTVVLAADLNDVERNVRGTEVVIEEGESIVGFLEGTETLNAGYCETTDINLVDVIVTDVTHIMGTGSQAMYSDTNGVTTNSVGFGQHGYVVASVDLSLEEKK